MQLPVVRKLVQNHSLDALKATEEALYEGQPLSITVEGTDEGEQLTHVLGAIWVLEQVADGADAGEALRAFATRVRNSIS
ncbi:MAG: hypothetical protein KF690_06655 [Bacteroidetes bacterium]|nr:hypothetical protein [Bacteroidota bacterium]